MRAKKSKTGKKIWFKKKGSLSVDDAIRKRRRTVELNLLADFLANRISAAGVSHVVKAPSAFRRTLWGIIIILTTAAMCVMTYRVLKEYLGYPTIMRSKSTPVSQLEFPAVTICGMSPVPKMFAKEAGLNYMEEMKSVFNDLPRYGIPEGERTRCLKDPLCYWSWFDDVCLCFRNPCQTMYCYPDIDMSDDKCACSKLLCQWAGSSESCYFDTDSNGTIWCICKTDFTYSLANIPDREAEGCSEKFQEHCKFRPGDLPEDFVVSINAVNTTDQIKDLWSKLKSSRTEDLRDVERFFVPPVSIMDNYGFPADSFILSCSYGIAQCPDLITLYTPSYGKCYMFNYAGDEALNNEEVKMVTQAGKQYGLQLFMRSSSKDSLPLLTRQLGVRLIIHDPKSIPIASEEGIDLRPGDMTSINMEYTEINRLGYPWGECADNGQKLGNYSKNPYKQNDCERACVSMEVFRRCHCYHPKFLRATTVPRRGSVCSTNDSSSEEDRCFKDTMDDNDKGKIKCNCPPACKEKVYEISMSTSKLNEEFFRIVKIAKSLTMLNGSPAITNGDFESSLMGVQIFYNSLFATSINETAIYSWESLVANIGGNMGLFLGLSLVTFLEIAEFFADIIYNAMSKRRSRASKVKDVIKSYY